MWNVQDVVRKSTKQVTLPEPVNNRMFKATPRDLMVRVSIKIKRNTERSHPRKQTNE